MTEPFKYPEGCSVCPSSYIPNMWYIIDPQNLPYKDEKGRIAYFDSREEAEAALNAGENTTHITPVSDSPDKQTFPTGAQRDTQEGKSRPDLLPPDALLRVGQHYARGAEKYSPRNWEKGMPFSRVNASLTRHLLQWQSGDRTEDHLSAMAFNVLALIAFEERIKAGLLPAFLDDMRGE